MLFPSFLIILFAGFFGLSLWRVLKTRDLVFAVFYSYLFVYTIFTQMGYVFFPDSAIRLRVYFGLDLFYSYWLFIFLSFVAIVGLFLFYVNLSGKRLGLSQPASIGPSESRLPFQAVAGGYVVILLNLFYWNFEGIRYASIDSPFVAYLINLQPIVLLILYMDLRRSKRSNQKLLTLLVGVVAAIMFLVISIRAGQRLAGLALLTGVAAFEFTTLKSVLARHNIGLKKIFSVRTIILAIAVAVFLMLAARIVALRERHGGVVPVEALGEIFSDRDSSSGLDLETLMYQDYFAPSSLLFVSMATGWVDPGEVFRSNFYNAVPFTGYPYLQNVLSEVANPISYSRSESYGYYLLNEGFNAAGWWGIIYNGIMVNLGLGLWRFLARARDPRFTERMTAVLCLLVVGIVRGPSVFFVRSVYVSILPALVLISLSLRYYPGLFQNGRKKAPAVGQEGPSHRFASTLSSN